MGKEIDPADIGKHPDLIKKAQSEIAHCDVLVCGRCHTVFHLIELFREHKESEPDCKRSSTSTLHECGEAQAKVWAFLLWKSVQRSAAGEERSPTGTNNSWKLYQAWVKLEESVRDTWIVAGKTIQSFSKTGAGSLQEMPVKITKTIVETPNESQDKKPTGIVSAGNALNRIGASGIRKPGVEPTKPSTVETPKNRIIVGASGKKPDSATPLKSTGITASSTTPAKRSFATRTHPKTGVFSEEEVEKILAKRFSPIIKMHEYLVKWSKMANDQNTWEPLTHLHSCQSILEHFEVQLAKQKEQRAATAARALQQQREGKGLGAGSTTTTSSTSPVKSSPVSGIISNAGSNVVTAGNQLRPIRTTKATAMDRVKLWASGESVEDGTGVGMKRKLDDGESDAGLNDSDGVDASKKPRTDSTSAVSEALSKVSQSGSVKIMSVSGQVAAANKTGGAVNGTTGSSPKDANAADVVILKSPKDGVTTGITKKPTGVSVSPGTSPINRLSPRTGDAAKIKIVTKTEPGTVHGIFKIKSEPTGTSPQSSPKAVAGAGAVATATTVTSRPITISTSSSSTDSSGVTTRFIRRNVDGTEQLVKQTIRKAPRMVPATNATTPGVRPGVGTPVAIKSSTTGGTPVPKITTSSAIGQQQRGTINSPRIISTTQTNRVGPGGKIVTSAGAPGTVVRTSTVTRTPGATAAQQQQPAASEQKINALRRQGLNVVKRVVTGTGTPVPQTTIKKSEDDEAELMSERPATPPSPTPQQVLCPYTGKLLTEGEVSEPLPSPKAEAEEEKAEEKKPDTDGGAAGEADTQVQQLLTNEDGSPIFMAGEDGTLYQVAGKNAEGQTILIAQGADGEQHVLVTSQESEDVVASAAGTAGADGAAGGEAGSGVLTLDAAVSEAVAVPQEGQELTEEQAAQLQQSVDTNQELAVQTEESQDTQITAEVVQTDQPSPGGTRRVVLLLPDGSFMMTEVNDEQYQSLNLVN
uniref:Chromo domain-containing protein n=1 Tax=Anopheles farauti TaxID=69004 RepID=A0A182QNZ3_9DIPT